MSAVAFAEERWHEGSKAELSPLLAEHWEEIAHYSDIPLDVNWDAYVRASEMGILACYTARQDGALVGYAVYLVDRNAHYQGSLQAKQDVLYLDPLHRGNGTGPALIAFADQGLAAKGVQVVYHHVKLKYDFGPMLKRMGYDPIEMVWGRRLDKATQAITTRHYDEDRQQAREEALKTSSYED